MEGSAPQSADRAGDDGRTAAGSSAPRRLIDLDPEEALTLLTRAAFGRVVFTRRALPEIRLVNHILDDGLIIIRTRLVTRLARAVADQLPYPTVVAYQADDIDPVTRTGWSVVATGVARPVTDPERAARYEQLLRPWVDQRMDIVLAIEPQLVVGFRLEFAGDPRQPAAAQPAGTSNDSGRGRRAEMPGGGAQRPCPGSPARSSMRE